MAILPPDHGSLFVAREPPSDATVRTRKSRKSTSAAKSADRAAKGFRELGRSGSPTGRRAAAAAADSDAGPSGAAADSAADRAVKSAPKSVAVKSARGHANGKFLDGLFSILFRVHTRGKESFLSSRAIGAPPRATTISMGPTDLEGI